MIGIVQTAIYIITAVFFCKWIYRMSSNAHSIRAESMRHTPGWAVGFYFVPIMNLWKPCQTLWESYDAFIDDADQGRNYLVFTFWWGSWIVSNLLGHIVVSTTKHAEELDELMATSDVITNHAPTTEATTGMLDARLWRLVKDGALFVNTARADAADYDALLVELQSGRFTAALDVFPEEPLANNSPFRMLPNVILSPHAAGLTIESKLRLGETVADEFGRFFAGEPLHHRITVDMLFKMA